MGCSKGSDNVRHRLWRLPELDRDGLRPSREIGRSPVPVAQEPRPMAFAELERGRQGHRNLGPRPDRRRSERGRPRAAGLGKPAGMADRRSRHHGRRRHYRAGLYHQHHRRPPASPEQFRRAPRHRLDPPAGRKGDRRRADRRPFLRRHHHRPAQSAAGSRHRSTELAGGDGSGRRQHRSDPRARRQTAPHRHRLPDLHLGHRRRAQGRDAEPRLDPGQLPRRP